MKTGVWLLNGMGSGFVGMTKIDKLRGSNKTCVFTKVFGDREAEASDFSYFRGIFPEERIKSAVEGLNEAPSSAFRMAIEYIFTRRKIKWEDNL
jgi:hypothetical protein